MGDKKRLARAGLEVMDRLDLPGELAAAMSMTSVLYRSTPRCCSI